MLRLPPDFSLGFEQENIEQISGKQLYTAEAKRGWMASIRTDIDHVYVEVHELRGRMVGKETWYSGPVKSFPFYGPLDPFSLKAVIIGTIDRYDYIPTENP